MKKEEEEDRGTKFHSRLEAIVLRVVEKVEFDDEDEEDEDEEEVESLPSPRSRTPWRFR